ncbi:MAG: hypothetical protein ACI9Y1_003676 [Lentisphaeria bacterium]|jgi:hypothetical protein
MHKSLSVECSSIFFPKDFSECAIVVFRPLAQAASDLVDAMVSYAKRITYADFFEEIAGRNPRWSGFYGRGMALVRLFHPNREAFSICWSLLDKPLALQLTMYYAPTVSWL